MSTSGKHRPVLITGGAGFIGCNLADRLLSSDEQVIVLDNLSRKPVSANLKWLKDKHGSALNARIGDVRDPSVLRSAVRESASVFHLAAQVAVTTSLIDPIEDFEINARGTLLMLEAARTCPEPPMVLFTSTNKVYGSLADIAVEPRQGRYQPSQADISMHGVSERRPLEFHSAYGCSKGAADQYVLDYARTFHLPSIVFRMSCIYGPHQYGSEDQGWVAHFLLQALQQRPITIYGDGRQVRDVLFVEDLVDAMLLARDGIGKLAGRAFNIGGGPGHTTSLLELLDRMERMIGSRPEVAFEDWRPADQKYYVSDVRAFGAATGWAPRTSLQQGLSRLRDWWTASRGPMAAERNTA